MVLCCGLKLITRYVNSESSWEGIWYRPRSATACALSIVTWYSDLKMAATHAGLGTV